MTLQWGSVGLNLNIALPRVAALLVGIVQHLPYHLYLQSEAAVSCWTPFPHVCPYPVVSLPGCSDSYVNNTVW